MRGSCDRVTSGVLAAALGLTHAAAAAAQTAAPATAATTPPPQSPAPGSLPERPSAPSAGADEEASDASAGEWRWRDRMLSESDTLSGGTGLLHTQHAETGAQGQFRMSLVGEWFSQGFLCTPKFPCPNPSGGAPYTSDRLDHVGGTLSLGVSLLKTRGGAVDLYASMVTYANSDAENRPELLQVLGDTDLGVKYVAAEGDYLNLGALAELWFVNGTGSVGLDAAATSEKLGVLGTLDLRGSESSPIHLPLRISVNASYEFDNTGAVLQSVESETGVPVSRIDQYGLGVNRVDHFDFLLGVEGLLADERVRPFVEGHLQVANNRQGYRCDPDNPNHDDCLETDPLTPATMTLGVRVFPWKRAFSLLAAADIGLTGSNFIEELQPVAPWTLYAGVGWSVDTRDRPAPVRRRAPSLPPRGHVVGFVHERDKAEPIAYAIAAYRNRPDLSPLATGADGKFGDDLPPGAYTYELRAEGYEPGSCDATVPPRGAAAPIAIDCPLDALPRVGSVAGRIHDADTGQPIAGAPIAVKDEGQGLVQHTDAGGSFRFDALPPGVAMLTVEVDGYMVQIVPVEVKAHRDSAIDLMLRPLPKQPKVVITAHELAIKDQIQFALDSAVILPDSYGLLGEVADTFIRHPEIKRVEVQGHTDNTGSPAHNRRLSEERAEAVRTWIVEHGVDASRLVAYGYGPDKPLVPNVTAANRARNRRVQFIIEDRDGAAPVPPTDDGRSRSGSGDRAPRPAVAPSPQPAPSQPVEPGEPSSKPPRPDYGF